MEYWNNIELELWNSTYKVSIPRPEDRTPPQDCIVSGLSGGLQAKQPGNRWGSRKWTKGEASQHRNWTYTPPPPNLQRLIWKWDKIQHVTKSKCQRKFCKINVTPEFSHPSASFYSGMTTLLLLCPIKLKNVFSQYSKFMLPHSPTRKHVVHPGHDSNIETIFTAEYFQSHTLFRCFTEALMSKNCCCIKNRWMLRQLTDEPEWNAQIAQERAWLQSFNI